MPIVRLTESITLRSAPLLAGSTLDVDAQTAAQMIAAGHAEPVPPALEPKTPKTLTKE